jgi:hypothetical protein
MHTQQWATSIMHIQFLKAFVKRKGRKEIKGAEGMKKGKKT